MQKIADNIYVESELSICNASVVVTGAGVVVIDTPMIPANAKKMATEIARFGPVRYVINTEPHGDHISGNCCFGGQVVVHEGTRNVIMTSDADTFREMLRMTYPDSPPVDDDFYFPPPDITFSERLTLYLGNHTFRLINLPGHTPYQVAVHVPEERIVFTSDNIVAGTMPYFHQALPLEWLKNLEVYKKLDVDRLVPGHGPIVDKSYIPQMSQIVRTFIDTVRAAIAEGMSLEEAQENVTFEGLLPQIPRDERSVDTIRMNVARLYEVLKR
jgi:cyclase